MTNQLTLLNSDNSFVEAFFISDSLYQKLVRITGIFELERLDLAFLHEIRLRALSTCSQKIRTAEPLVVSPFASVALDWFDELLALTEAISQLPFPHSLSITLR